MEHPLWSSMPKISVSPPRGPDLQVRKWSRRKISKKIRTRKKGGNLPSFVIHVKSRHFASKNRCDKSKKNKKLPSAIVQMLPIEYQYLKKGN